MNKVERIKAGFTGKKLCTNLRTGEKDIVDFDDPKGGCMISMK